MAGQHREVRDRGRGVVGVDRREHHSGSPVEFVVIQVAVRIVLAQQGEYPVPVFVAGQSPRRRRSRISAHGRFRTSDQAQAWRATTAVP